MSGSSFYTQPARQKRSVQIIREAKAEIKKMEMHRPPTPFGRKSTLHKESIPLSRSSSCTSVRSLQYEVSQKRPTSGMKLQPINVEKDITDCIKLEPIVVKTSLVSRNPRTSPKKSHNETEFKGFPPITDGECLSPDCDPERKTCNSLLSFEQENDNALYSDVDFERAYETYGHITEHETSTTTIQSSAINAHVSTTLDTTESSTTMDLNQNNVFCSEISLLIPKLEKLVKQGKKRTEEQTGVVVDKIYVLLKQHGTIDKNFDQRVPLLKLLFRLFDSSHPALSLLIAKTVLEMKVVDKNLVNVFRLISKIINAGCVNLNECDILDSLLQSIDSTSIIANKEAAYYGTTILKCLIFENMVDETFVLQHNIPMLFRHLCELNFMISAGDKKEADFELVVTEVVTLLHYLANEENGCEAIIKNESLSEIFKVLSQFTSFKDVLQISIRLISKIAEKEEGSYALAGCDVNIPLTFISIFEACKFEPAVLLQLTFIVGNLVSVDEKQALDFLTCSGFQEKLTAIFEDYVQLHTETGKRTVHSALKNKVCFASGDRAWKKDIADVILKSLHIWTNMICLSPKAGYVIAHDEPFINRLLPVIMLYSAENANFTDQDMVLGSLLILIGNISYYLSTESKSTASKIAKSIMPFLDADYDFALRFEAANITRNLTRSPVIRKYISDHSLYPAFIKLLNEDEKEMTLATYGIIINILIDQAACESFYKEQGISRVLHKLHMCSGLDWKMSTLLCQILLNYCNGGSSKSIPLSKIEVQHLLKFLSYSINTIESSVKETCENIEESSCQAEFCSVAKKLLVMLSTKNTYMY